VQLLVHPAADRELAQAVRWSRQHFGKGAATRLRQRVGQAAELLLREPGVGTPATAGAQSLPLAGYPYTLVYRVHADVVHVLASMHQSRLPDYWVQRA
jgi:plasmid stabilization system protein ParE